MNDPIKCFMIRPVEQVTFDVAGGSGTTHLYADDNGARYTIRSVPLTLSTGEVIPVAPVGAMWDCDWYQDTKHQNGTAYDRNPDGMVLCVKTPDGDWLIDGPSYANRQEVGYWTRGGVAPNITVTPSISQPTYHGWLKNGYLEAC